MLLSYQYQDCPDTLSDTSTLMTVVLEFALFPCASFLAAK